MTLFAPNGLLGSTSALKTNAECTDIGGNAINSKSSLPDTPSEEEGAFGKPAGLLLKQTPSFTLTSLLSKAKSAQKELSLDSMTVTSEDTPVPFGQASLLSASDTLNDEATSFSSTSTFGRPSGLLDPEQSIPIELAPPGSIPATTFDGKTIFFKKRKRTQPPTTLRSSSSSPFSKLLDRPIHRLLDDLSLQVAQNLQNPATEPSRTSTTTCEDTLWVDRYRPTCFTDLIGNDRVARETMAWVKQWDFCVFGKARGKKRQRDDDENFNADDEYHRPREKILLLSGPPGLGKTTLAHVVARHAGYDVMEINASDARAGNVVDERIRPTLEAGQILNSKRPVLLVIDEIDGATGAGENTNSFISNLVQLTQNIGKKKKRPGQKQQQGAQRPLLRPIICICNDANASSLAKLRPHAYQVRFTRPADFHTVRRLQEICEIEGLRTEIRALNTLVAVAKGDFRGCINTLQFVKSRKEEVTETVIRKATVGMKEGDVSILSVVNSIFNPLTKKRVKELAMTEEQESRYVARLSHEIESSGKDAAIANGCFEHYATLHHHDANFTRYESANEWLVTYDTLSSSMFFDGDFALYSYLSYTLVPFYPLFQTRSSQRIERSYSDWEHHQLTKSNEGIYESLARCLRTASLREGAYRHFSNAPILQLEFTPFINRIISPPLRPVNSQVIRSEERLLLTRLVDIMAALELQFVQDRGEDGQLSYRLEPPIDVFVTYDGKRAGDIAASRYAVRHLVATEVDATLATRNFEAVEKAGKVTKRQTFGQPKASSEAGSHAEAESGPAQKRQKLDPPKDATEKTPTDFFGRAITVKSSINSKSAARAPKAETYLVTYKFHEGNSAAVRKPVKLNTFL